ncbi:MAG TPA: YIP1 family protein [Candidatus Acidoferrum sp.]|jgi:hypothetical protein|nr:YIP1 family protein [Candidatus Acidoferrum sp.]
MEAPPPLSQSEPPVAPPPTTSLVARLMNVFAVPGDVFAEVKAARPTAANWLMPIILLSLIGAVAAIIIVSQPAIQQQMREAQTKALDQKVKAGKMTQAQADQAMEVIDKFMGPTMWKVMGAAGAVIISVLRMLWWALVLWLLGRWLLKKEVGYVKTLEVVGLALMISALGTLVTVLLQVNFSRMFATPSLALVINDFDVSRKSHLMLGAVNVFSIWQVAVLAIGLSKLAGAPFLRAAWVVFTYWVLQESFLILVGLGQMAL